VTCDKALVFSASSGFLHQKTDRNDIAEILLKVALNSIKQRNKQTNGYTSAYMQLHFII
jgi:hypothetical protein